VGLGVAIDYLTALDLRKTAAYEHELLAYATTRLRDIPGLRIVGTGGGPLLVTAIGLKDWGGVSFPATMPMTVIAGFIVGFGSIVGSGCTSGHGVCGLARFSLRSFVATATFLLTGIITTYIVRHLFNIY